MNILYVSSKKGWGGIVSWMQRTALGLEKRGHKVWIISPPNSRFSQQNKEDLRIIKRGLGVSYNPFILFFLVRFIKKNRIDLVVSNIQKEVFAAGLAARLTAIPNIRRIGTENDINNKIKWSQLNLVNHTISPCQIMIDRSLDRFDWLDMGMFSKIYNGKNSQQYSELDIENQRKKWSLKKSDFVIGCTSQLTRVKGIDILLYVFRQILNQHPNVHLVISGDGVERNHLEKLSIDLKLEKRVHFAGFTSDPLMAASAYNIALSNSSFEGFPNTVVEYMAAGKPLVATDVDGVSEIVNHNENGLLVEFGQKEQLKEALSLLISDTDLRERLSKNALQTIESGFSEEHMINKLESLFGSIIDKKVSNV